MIENIFSFLAYDEHLRATEVCSRWKDIFETRVIYNTLLTITNKNREGQDQNCLNYAVRKLAKSTRTYRDLKLADIDFAIIERSTEIQFSVMIANIGINIVNLILQDCRLTYGKLLMIVQLLKHVQTIRIDNCSIFHDSMPVPEFMAIVENIQKVEICDVETEDDSSLANFLIRSNSANIILQMNYSCIEPKVELIENYASRLKQLACVYNETRTIRRILGSAGLALESLKLHRNPSAAMHFLTYRETIATQTNLRELIITMPISLRILADISRNLSSLEFLKAKIDDYETDESIPFKWPKLKTLDLTLSGEADVMLHEMEFDSRLEELRLHASIITKYTMMHIYEKCNELRKLTLAALSLLRCEKMFGSIGERLPHLSEIELQCGSRTTFIYFFESVLFLKHLRTLAFIYCDLITNKTLTNVKLPYLRKLEIVKNVKISKEGLQHLFTNCPRISSLTLRGCPGIDDDAVQVIVACLPWLEYLDISKSARITLNSIRLIFEGCRFLKDLQIDDCGRLLIEWRQAPCYIHSFHRLKKYYNAYPEYFYSYLPVEKIGSLDSDFCYYEDSSVDLSDIGDYEDDDEPSGPLNDELNHDEEEAEHIIVISDDE